MLPTLTGEFRLVDDAQLRFTPAGKAVCNVRLAASHRTKDAAGEWQDGDKLFIAAAVWGEDAEAAAELTKGARVLASGRLATREWEQDGQKRSAIEMQFATIAPLPDRRAQRATTPPPADDPWASAPSNDAPPF